MTASCTDPQFNWLFNKEGQSPCEIAYQLANACNTGSGGNPGVLTPDHQYPSLAPADSNPCTCNTVRYAMIVGCSACQSRSYLTFPQYTQSCSNTYNQQFPATIPAGTAVPHYAYLALVDGQFNWSGAQVDQGQNPPESTGGSAPATSKQQNTPSSTTTNPQTTTQNSPSTQGQATQTGNQNTVVTSPQTTNAPAGSTNSVNTKPIVTTIASNGTFTVITYSGTIGGTLPTSSGGSGSGVGAAQPTSVSGTSESNSGATSSGSSKAGPIAGGVVGGIAVICLFLGFVWWLRQRERRLREANEHLRPIPLMAQYRDAEAVEPPPYAPSDVATVSSSNGPPFTKSATRQMNTYQQYTNIGAGPSGHRPMPSEGGSSSAWTNTGSRSGSDQV